LGNFSILFIIRSGIPHPQRWFQWPGVPECGPRMQEKIFACIPINIAKTSGEYIQNNFKNTLDFIFLFRKAITIYTTHKLIYCVSI
jgi:hypothetical protein